jgi:hypothetical protein
MRTRVTVSVMRAAILSSRARVWNGVAHCQHEPVGGGLQHETHLIGERRTATGAVRGKLTFVQLDQILGLTALKAHTA